MAKQTIGIGTFADDGNGDPLRTAFTKSNDNFTEIYSGLAPSSGVIDVRTTTELFYWSGSQAQYDALTPDANTIYFIS